MSHIVASNQVDSQGGDCTNPDTHTVRVAVITDESGGGGGGGGGGILDQFFTQTFNAPNVDWVIDVTRFTVISIALGAATTGNDGTWIVAVSNDGGVSYQPWFFSSTALDTARAQIPVYFGSNSQPAFISVAGLTHVRFHSQGFSSGSAVLNVRATTAPMWQPTQGVYLMDGRGGSIAFVDDGRVEVNVMNQIEFRKVYWGIPEAPATATVTAASATLVDGTNQNGIVLTNLSATEPVFLGFGHPAVLNSGVVIFPRERLDLSDRTIGGIEAIVATGPVTVAIQRFN